MTLPLGMELENLSTFEWVVVALSAVAALWAIVKAVKLTLHPGEEEPDHVKRVIFQEPPMSPQPRMSPEPPKPPPPRPPEAG
jgi:hypothetical protein